MTVHPPWSRISTSRPVVAALTVIALTVGGTSAAVSAPGVEQAATLPPRVATVPQIHATHPYPPAKPQSAGAQDIRVQLVTTLDATIGAPMSGRLSQFPLHDGDRFNQGTVLARFVCTEQQGLLARARAVLDSKRAVLASTQRLHQLGTATQVDYEVAQAAAQEAAAEVQAAQAVIENCVVIAPFSGRVANVSARNFQYVTQGAPLLEILNDKSLEASAIVPSAWLSWLKVGTRFAVSVDETGQAYHAEVTHISGKVDAVSQSIKIYGKFLDPAADLRPGMTGRALLAPPSAGK